MSQIRALDASTARMLSCSQVATSVHTVVKELVENSLDAAATNVEVKLENYGLDVLEVRDNGSGVSRDAALLVALPHFTSKLVTLSDLSSLETYGFRGEALTSIAAIGSVKLTSCCEGEEVATTYTLDHNGEVQSRHPSHHGRGTTVTVSALFGSLPVRRQLYRRDSRCKEELRRVEGLLLALGIAHPGLRLLLRHNRSVVWQKTPAADFSSNLCLILGSAVTQQLVSLSWQNFDPTVKIVAYVPKPSLEDFRLVTRATPDRMFVLVNRRPVSVRPLSQLLRRVFHEACASQAGRSPVAVLCVDVPPADLDVNLEPNKTTVLLENLGFIVSSLTTLLRGIYFPSGPDVPKLDDSLTADTGAAPACSPAAHTPELLDVSDLQEDMFSEAASLEESFEEFCRLDDCGLEGPGDSSHGDSLADSSHGDSIADSGADTAGCVEQASGSGGFTLSQWSRGEGWRAYRPLEPVRLLRPPSPPRRLTAPVQSKLTYKGASAVYDMVRSQPVKRKAEEPAREEEDEEEGCKRQRTLQDDSDSEREVTTLPFHLPTISQRLTQAGGCSSQRASLPDAVIGYCNPPGVWLVVVSGIMALFNVQSLCEADPATLDKDDVSGLLRVALKDGDTQTYEETEQFFYSICAL